MRESDKQASISLHQPTAPEMASSPSAYPSSLLHTPDVGCNSFMAQAFFFILKPNGNNRSTCV